MPYLTINIAEAGTTKINGDKSPAGHMWYTLIDSNENPTDYGYGPEGRIENDSNTYLGRYYSRTVWISQEQYDAMKNFGEKPETYGFSKNDYKLVNNSCVDFVWKALELGGFNSELFEGSPVPSANKYYVDRALSDKPILDWTQMAYTGEESDTGTMRLAFDQQGVDGNGNEYGNLSVQYIQDGGTKDY